MTKLLILFAILGTRLQTASFCLSFCIFWYSAAGLCLWRYVPSEVQRPSPDNRWANAEHCWSHNWQGKIEEGKRNLSQCHFVHQKFKNRSRVTWAYSTNNGTPKQTVSHLSHHIWPSVRRQNIAIGSNTETEYSAINDMFTLGSWQQANWSPALPGGTWLAAICYDATLFGVVSYKYFPSPDLFF